MSSTASPHDLAHPASDWSPGDTGALAPVGETLPAHPVVGEARTWSRDFAVMGGLTGLLAPGLVPLVLPVFPLASSVMGAATGAAVGAILALGLERVRGRVPLLVIAALTLPLGALWGASAGIAGAVVGGAPELTALAAAAASLAGALQLLWLWLPYTMCAVLRRPTWPLVVAAGVAAPLLGWAVLFALLVLF